MAHSMKCDYCDFIVTHDGKDRDSAIRSMTYNMDLHQDEVHSPYGKIRHRRIRAGYYETYSGGLKIYTEMLGGGGSNTIWISAAAWNHKIRTSGHPTWKQERVAVFKLMNKVLENVKKTSNAA
jgi:hypothetical protein